MQRQSGQMDASKLRVIVVGGGPVGLTAALALERAGIDFVLLESRSNVVIDAGSNLVLLPIGLRAFYQLGLRDPLNAVSSPLDRIHRMDHTGRDIGDAQWFIEMRKKYVCQSDPLGSLLTESLQLWSLSQSY